MLIGGIFTSFTFNRAVTGQEEMSRLAEEYTELMFTLLLEGVVRNRS
jgi:hypothetical protein